MNDRRKCERDILWLGSYILNYYIKFSRSDVLVRLRLGVLKKRDNEMDQLYIFPTLRVKEYFIGYTVQW